MPDTTIERKLPGGGILRVTREPVKPKPPAKPPAAGEIKKALVEVRGVIRDQRAQLATVERAFRTSRKYLRKGDPWRALVILESAAERFLGEA